MRKVFSVKMMKSIIVAFCSLPLLCGAICAQDTSVSAPAPAKAVEKVPPLADFTDWTAKGDKIMDKTGKVTLLPGKTFQEGKGPFGGKAMIFDGFKTSVCTIDLGELGKRLDGFEYAFSFWFRSDETLDTRSDARLSGNSPGLNVTIGGGNDSANVNIPWLSGGGISANFAINVERWNHIAVVFSVEKRIRKIYVNGYPVLNVEGVGKFYPLRQNTSGKYTIGTFRGAIADLQIWDKVIDPSQFLNMDFTAENEKDVSAHLDKILADCGNAPGAVTMVQNMRKELATFKANKVIAMDAYNAFLKRLNMAEKLVASVNGLSKTSLKNAPFSLLVVPAISSVQRTPNMYPPDADKSFKAEVTAIAAKDEYTSSSFLIFPYQDLKKIEFELNDLKNDKGQVISKDEIELKFVQCWFQPGWNSYFNGHGSYNPALLLNDPDLLRIDERNRINYLRLNYPSGVQYANICIPGSVLKHPGFDYAFEPVADSDVLLPVPCEFGRNRQFWMDIHVPKTAAAGIYRGKVNIKTELGDAGFFTLALRVLPFELPLPRTQFDHKKLFTQNLCSGLSIKGLTETMKNPVEAEKLAYRHIINQKKHSMLMQPFEVDPDDPEAFRKTIAMHKEQGLAIELISGGSGFVSYFMECRESNKTLAEVATPERVEADYKKYYERLEKIIALVDKEVGRHDMVHFYGIDEAQDAGTLRSMMMYRDPIFRNGMFTMTTGWEDNYRNDPSHEYYHTTAALVSRENANKWHAMPDARITCYCGPFIGPDNPDLMRKSHGFKMFRNNYDGWWELAYDSGKYHTWNHLFGYDTTYRPFRFVIDTVKGPIINTIAFCGMREGQDDVRYATLLYQLADECMESGDPDKIIAARKAIVWFRNLEFPFPNDMYACRAGMIENILTLMKLLGKNMN